jgi:photosystem II stability/assembly factor-like uncharacterized protein
MIRIIKYLIFFIVITSSTLLSQMPKLIGPIGGFVVDVSLHKNFSSVIYASNTSGACFRSIDGGSKVTPIRMVGDYWYYFYPAPTDTSLCFAMTPTGERLLRSTNSGIDFELVNIDGDDNNVHLQFNPFNSEVIYLIRNENQLWKSYNRGDNWQKIKTFDTTITTRVAVAPSDTSVVYVVATDGIYRSTDSGLSWELRGQIPGFIGRIIQLEVNPQNKNSIYLFGGSYYKFYKSSDGGKTFGIIQSNLFINEFVINPLDTNIVYYASDTGIYKSNDGGLNYFSINNGLPTGFINSGTIVLNPFIPSEIYAGITYEGVYKSTDAGDYWFQSNLSCSDVRSFELFPNNIGHLIASQYPWFLKTTTDDGETWVYSNYIPPYDSTYGVSYFYTDPFNDNEAYLTDYFKTYKTSDAGLNWQQVSPFNNSTVLWFNNFNSSILFGTDGTNLWRSTDNGTNWAAISSGLSYDRFVFDPQNDSTIYAYSVVIHLLKSTDMGSTWQLKTNGLILPGTGNPAIISGVVIRKDNPNILYCVQNADGGISKSTDGGENWFQIDSSFRTLNTTMGLTSIYLDENISGRFYVSTNGNGSFTNGYSWGGLFLTEDDGLTWRRLFTGSVTNIKADNSNPKNIYFNTYYGIMKIPDTLTTNITSEQNLIPKDFLLSQNYPNPFNPSTKISWQSQVSSWQTLKVYDILGNEVATLVDEYRNAGSYAVDFQSTVGNRQLANGVYFYRLHVDNYIETKKMLLLK